MNVEKQGYDGYRITNAGYDILALHNLKSRGSLLLVSAYHVGIVLVSLYGMKKKVDRKLAMTSLP
jgi:RIO-like serine/threonine protein kinase